MHPFRVFICYAHEDRDLAEQLARALEDMDLEPWYDRHISPGTPFTEEIKAMIMHAHLFVPIITNSSQNRPWVHQETGYAMALNVPVLPLVFDDLPGEMMAQLQGLRVQRDLSDLVERLAEVNLDRIVSPPPPRPKAIVEVAQWPEERTRMLSEYARRVTDMGAAGCLRQWGALSSFCIPDADVSDPIWQLREGRLKRSDYYHQLQREERQALESHVRRKGCRLIIDPEITFAENGPGVRRVRLQTLRDALDSLRKDGVKVEVITSGAAREGSLTILGDWFVADSQVPRPGQGYHQTVFTWHAPTVLSWIRRFDQQFGDLCARAPASRGKILGPKVAEVVAYLDSILDGLPSLPVKGDDHSAAMTS